MNKTRGEVILQDHEHALQHAAEEILHRGTKQHDLFMTCTGFAGGCGLALRRPRLTKVRSLQVLELTRAPGQARAEALQRYDVAVLTERVDRCAGKDKMEGDLKEIRDTLAWQSTKSLRQTCALLG